MISIKQIAATVRQKIWLNVDLFCPKNMIKIDKNIYSKNTLMFYSQSLLDHFAYGVFSQQFVMTPQMTFR